MIKKVLKKSFFLTMGFGFLLLLVLGCLLMYPEGVIGEEIPESALKKSVMHCEYPLCLGDTQEQGVDSKSQAQLLRQDKEGYLKYMKTLDRLLSKGLIGRRDFLDKSARINNYLRIIELILEECQSTKPDMVRLEDWQMRLKDFAI